MPQVAPLPERETSRTRAIQTGWSAKLHHVSWQIFHHTTKHTGVGIICSVCSLFRPVSDLNPYYAIRRIDKFPSGSWGVDLQAGSQFGYTLLFTVLLCGIIATFLQVLAARLGTVTGLDLASHCRLLFHDRPRHKLLWRWGVHYPLYALAEIAIICTDLSEMLGSAIALVLLFPALPLWSTVLLTAADVMLLLALENPLKSRPVKLFEAVITVLVLIVLICMAIIMSKITVNWADCFRGFIPSKRLFASGSLYTSVGIVGATVMPHSLFLGSHLATQDRLTNDSKRDLPPFSETSSSHQMTLLQRLLQSLRYAFDWRRLFRISHSDETIYPPNVRTHADRENNSLSFVRSHMYHGMADVIISLMGFAVIINSLILIISSAVFYYNSGAYGSESPASLSDAYSLIKDTMGTGTALLFALALLASGQSASIVATVAGQSVSEGFLHWKVTPTLRRLITRVLGLIPSIIVASVMGENGINVLLVGSQVALSVILPFFIFPLVYLTSSLRIMSVKSQSMSIPAQPVSGSAVVPVDDGSGDKEGTPEDEVVDFSNGKIVTGIGYIIWIVIVAANIYALATL